MVKSIFVIIFLLLVGTTQSQNLGFTYQAVAIDQSKAQGFGRDSQGEVLANKDVKLRFSLLEGSENGTITYQETHQTKTDIFGIFRLIIGRGLKNTSNRLEELDWGNIAYFLQVEIDLGDGFEIIGVEELFGSPYALNTVRQSLSLHDDELSLSNSNTVRLEDNDATNELISKVEVVGNELRITDAGGVRVVNLSKIPAFEENATDEIQDLQLVDGILSITNNASATGIVLTDATTLSEIEIDAYVSNNGYLTEEQDGSPTNELQDISLSGSDLSISGGSSIDLSHMDTDTQLTEAEVDAFVSDNGYLTTELDGSVTNEIQDIILSGTSLSISDGSTIDLSGVDTNTDDQSLSLTGTTLDIEDGTGVDLSVLQDGIGTDDQELTLLGNILSIEDGNTIDLSGYQNTDTQDLSTDGTIPGNIGLTDGGNITINVDDADADAVNEIQDLSLNDATDILTITNNPSATDIDLSPYISPFTTTGTTTSNENGDYANDSFLFGSPQMDDDGNHQSRMFFDKSKGAFRGGYVDADQWDEGNVGEYSTAMGYNTIASYQYSTALGANTIASGWYSTAIGNAAEASGTNSTALGANTWASGWYTTAIGSGTTAMNGYSTAMGLQGTSRGYGSTVMGIYTEAFSYAETSLGSYNTHYSPNSSTYYNPNDRLLVVGNGFDPDGITATPPVRQDALVMLKSGNTTLNGQLTIDADNIGGDDGYTLPAQDGTSGQIITTDGSGVATWAALANQVQDLSLNTTTDILTITGNPATTNIDLSPYNSPFSITGTTTSNENGDYTNDDFVFGSPQMDDDGNADHQSRMFFDKSQSAFRAGFVSGDQWDESIIGWSSVAIGYNNISSAAYSTTFGLGNIASDLASTAFGSLNVASGYMSVAMGRESQATAEWTTAMGRQTLAGGQSSTAMGYLSEAHGSRSTAMGYGTQSIGANSTAMGNLTIANSFAETALGSFNTSYSPVDFGFNLSDRLLVVGNGTEEASRSDALLLYKSGDMTLHGELTIDADNVDGAGEPYTLPAQDGIAGQIITTDGSGVATWAAPVSQIQDLSLNTTTDILTITDNPTPANIDLSPYISPFATTNTTTSNENGDYANDDFVFGSSSLDNDVAGTDDDFRMFFDKSKGAFRAGYVEADQWNDANVGVYSVAMGFRTTASLDYAISLGFRTSASSYASVALGYWTTASGTSATSMGQRTLASGAGSTAMGSDTEASGRYSAAMGFRTIARSYGEAVLGVYNTDYAANGTTFDVGDRLLAIGNGTGGGSRSDALLLYKSGDMTLHGELTIDADNVGGDDGYTLPGQDGTDGQVLTTDGAGQTSWQEPAIPVGGIIMWSGAICRHTCRMGTVRWVWQYARFEWSIHRILPSGKPRLWHGRSCWGNEFTNTCCGSTPCSSA